MDLNTQQQEDWETSPRISYQEFKHIVLSCEPGDDRLAQLSLEYPMFWRWYCQNTLTKIHQKQLTQLRNSV